MPSASTTPPAAVADHGWLGGDDAHHVPVGGMFTAPHALGRLISTHATSPGADPW